MHVCRYNKEAVVIANEIQFAMQGAEGVFGIHLQERRTKVPKSLAGPHAGYREEEKHADSGWQDVQG